MQQFMLLHVEFKEVFVSTLSSSSSNHRAAIHTVIAHNKHLQLRGAAIYVQTCKLTVEPPARYPH